MSYPINCDAFHDPSTDIKLEAGKIYFCSGEYQAIEEIVKETVDYNGCPLYVVNVLATDNPDYAGCTVDVTLELTGRGAKRVLSVEDLPLYISMPYISKSFKKKFL